MHDEAAAHYIDMIDQTTLGHQFILQEFGVLPKVGWQIDPFGHSATQAALLSASVGFEALFFGRMDHQDHDARMADKVRKKQCEWSWMLGVGCIERRLKLNSTPLTLLLCLLLYCVPAQNMEFIWRASASLGADAELFTGGFQNGNYGPPSGFCFDSNCGDTPMISDPTFINYNVPDRVQAFLDQINYQAAFTRGSELMVTMGSDFQYENAREWYENLDKLIAAVNEDGRISMQYSTPSIYVEAKNKENITLTLKTDDFFRQSRHL